MSLVFPFEFISSLKQNGQFCGDTGPEYELVSTSNVQVMEVAQLPAARFQSSYGDLSTSLHIPVASRNQTTDELVALPRSPVHSSSSSSCISNYATNTGFASSSNSKYVGLPYQDHNYVQMPPSTPPPQSSHPLPMPAVAKTNPAFGDALVIDTGVGVAPDDSITRCICEFQHDDGYMIQCDRCGVWQHVDCMEVDRDNIPDSYMCELCEPRKVDKHRAIQIQSRKRDALSLQHLDSSATETEDETTDGRRRSFDQSPVKKELKEGNNSNYGGTGSVASFTLTKRRKTKSKRDERLKKKLHLKRQTAGQKLALSSPRKQSFDVYVADGLGGNEMVRPDTSLSQNGALVLPSISSPFNANLSPVEVYQEAAFNLYTVELQNLLASIKFNAQQVAACSPSVSEKLQQGPSSCLVAPVSSTRMGLEACEDILTNEPLVEYVGRVMLRDQYDKDNLFYVRPEPNILFYSKLGGLDLCIDASSYGNIARFVRRSCTPNAEVRHLLEGSTVRFFICASKSIVRGAEITIPFDFNYHKCSYAVDCACTRISCPVAKFQRRDSLHSSGPSAKRQRSMRSLEALPHQESPAILSPKKLQSSLSVSPTSSVSACTKQSKMSALSCIKNEPVAEAEVVKTEIKEEHDMKVKMEPLSPKWTPCSSTQTTTTPETDLHHLASHHLPVAAASNSVLSSSVSLNDAEETDKSKKKTREEKKLEAVMKMFEKLEKQEERKKEAQHRHEHVKGRESSKTRESRKSKDCKAENKNISEASSETIKTRDAHANITDQVEPVLSEIPIKQDSKTRVRRSRHSTSSRRASMSSTSGSLSGIRDPPISENIYPCQQASTGVADVASASVDDMPIDSGMPSTSHSTASAAKDAAASLLSLASAGLGFPKKLLMRGQPDLMKQLTIKTEGLESSSATMEVDDAAPAPSTEFVHCVPSPHSCSLNTLRRNSMPPAYNCSNVAVPPAAVGKTPVLFSSPALNGSTQTDNKGCSAKKRWLHQAMSDKTELQPNGEQMPGTYTQQLTTSSNSPTDFVTPLKKRRLARESMSSDSQPSGIKQEESNSGSSNVFPLYESISDDDHTDNEATTINARESTNREPTNHSEAMISRWEGSLLGNANLPDSVQIKENLIDGGISSAQIPMHAVVSQTALFHHQNAYLLMSAGGDQMGESRRTSSASIYGPVTSLPNGFEAAVSVESSGIMSWQTSYPPAATAQCIGSGMSAAGSYMGADNYLSNLITDGGAAAKLNSMNVPSLLDYRLSAFGSINPMYNASGHSSIDQLMSVSLRPEGDASSNAYLDKQPSAQPVSLKFSASADLHPMPVLSAMSASSADTLGIMVLAEAACQSRENSTAVVENHNRSTMNDSVHDLKDIASCRENGQTEARHTSFAFPLQSSDLQAKVHSYVDAPLALKYLDNAAENRVLDNAPPSGTRDVAGATACNPSNSPGINGFSGDGVMQTNPYNTCSSVTDWKVYPMNSVSNGGATFKIDAPVAASDVGNVDSSELSASVSSSVAGQCLSKKKVSLHEYKMRRKSGSTSQKPSVKAGLSLDGESVQRPMQPIDAALTDSSVRLSSETIVKDSTADGLSFAWSSNATEAEKAIENLSHADKLFQVEKGSVGENGSVTSASCALINRIGTRHKTDVDSVLCRSATNSSDPAECGRCETGNEVLVYTGHAGVPRSSQENPVAPRLPDWYQSEGIGPMLFSTSSNANDMNQVELQAHSSSSRLIVKTNTSPSPNNSSVLHR